MIDIPQNAFDSLGESEPTAIEDLAAIAAVKARIEKASPPGDPDCPRCNGTGEPKRQTEYEQLVAVEAKLDAARAKLQAAEKIWRTAQADYQAETRPLNADREGLLCNSEEWPESETPVANSPALLARFYVELTAPEFREHKNVPMQATRRNSLSKAEYEALLAPLTCDSYRAECIDDTFTVAEVEILHEFFAAVEPTWIFRSHPVTPIRWNQAGCTSCGYGGGSDGITWTNKETGEKAPADCPVEAFYRLCLAESGPHAEALAESNARNAQPVATGAETVITNIGQDLAPGDFYVDFGEGDNSDLRPFSSLSPELQREVADEIRAAKGAEQVQPAVASTEDFPF